MLLSVVPLILSSIGYTDQWRTWDLSVFFCKIYSIIIIFSNDKVFYTPWPLTAKDGMAQITTRNPRFKRKGLPKCCVRWTDGSALQSDKNLNQCGLCFSRVKMSTNVLFSANTILLKNQELFPPQFLWFYVNSVIFQPYSNGTYCRGFTRQYVMDNLHLSSALSHLHDSRSAPIIIYQSMSCCCT